MPSLSVSVLDGRVAVQDPALGTPVLGRLTWFTVPAETQLPGAALAGAFAVHGLRPKLLPPDIEPVDAFRRATSAVQKSRLPMPGAPDQYINLLVRELRGGDGEGCHRQVVREIVDSRNRRLEYSPAGDFLWDRERGFRASPRLGPGDPGAEAVSQALDQAVELYDRFRRAYQADALRALLRRYLRALQGVLVRESGGVYFVPEEHARELDRLGAFAQEIRSSWIVFPVVDAPSARATVRDAVVEDVARLLRALEDDLALEPGKRGLATLVGEAQGILALIDRYEQVLSQDLFDLGQNARLVRDAVVAALNAA